MKKVVLTASLFLTGVLAFAQTAPVQVVHNSPDLAVATVDVYVNGALALNDVDFRTASAFTDLPAGVPIELAVAPGTSTSVAEAVYTIEVTLDEAETYLVIAYGIVSATGYSPAPEFELVVVSGALQESGDPLATAIIVHHGSTDAPTVDVVETGVGAGTLIDDISSSETQGPLSVPTADYNLEVRLSDGVTQVAAYSAPLETLSLGGAAITVYASGFLDPSVNSDGPAFGLFAVTAAGGPFLPLPEGFLLDVNDVQQNTFAVYPNPTNNVLNIDGVNTQNLDYTVVDVNGRVVLEGTLATNNTITTSSLSQGLYILNLVDNNSIVKTAKFVKQ
jgi:hypothetical protein